MSTHWNTDRIPDQSGRRVVITGANSGIGFEAARALARRGAEVILACRDQAKAEDAAARIRADQQDTLVEVMELDLASLASVRRFSSVLESRFPRIDLLINNAGVMALPYRKTADGFEMQLGTNHLGHFALTGLLLPRLEASGVARVVTVSSLVHRNGRIRFDDLHWEKSYSKWAAYCQSKLANLLFTYELDRRLRRGGRPIRSVACHPGYSATNLQLAGPRMEGSVLGSWIYNLGNGLLAQSPAMGALPTLYAAVADDVEGGDYIGPGGFLEITGHPGKVSSSRASRDEETARRLWEISEDLTGVRFL